MEIIHGKVVLHDRIINDGFVRTHGSQIVALGEMSSYQSTQTDVYDAQGQFVLPGFIDQHIHGAAGADHMDANHEAYQTIVNALPKEGTTSYLPTTMTQSVESVSMALSEIKKFHDKNSKAGQAEMLGIHLEGPFISKLHIGAQNPKYVLKPTIQAFDRFWAASHGFIKLVTYAPEEAEEGFTDHLRSHHVIPSAGHTDAGYQEIMDEIPHGLSNLTHFHNAMLGHHHRRPGAVTAGFVAAELKAELIVDGIHLEPSVVAATLQIKKIENCIGITDAMRAKGLPDGQYDLGGQIVNKSGMECRLDNGTLAGSVVEMNLVARNLLDFAQLSMLDLVKVTSSNAAKHLGVYERKGSIEIGKDADLVVVDDRINVLLTLCRGEVGYQV